VCSFEMDHIWYYKNAVFFFLLGKCLSLSLIPFSRGKRSAIGLMNSSNDHFYYDKYYNLSLSLYPSLSLLSIHLSPPLSLSPTPLSHPPTHHSLPPPLSISPSLPLSLCREYEVQCRPTHGFIHVLPITENMTEFT